MKSPELLALTASEPLTLEEEFENMKSWREDEKKLTFIILDRSIGENYMVGDVNLYFHSDTEDGKRQAEIEVMIAESLARRKGLAQRALQMLMAFAVETLSINVFIAKVLDHNAPSIALFTTKLDFQEERKVPVFREIHYRREVNREFAKKLEALRNQFLVESFARSTYADLPDNGEA
ncbi:Acetyltransferase (GNAT) [Gracilaria domingensis]|nr:Acetyltransferase (GNAT) [Gracilaria domingensis]